ncbi:electron transport complex subunit RsxD [Aliikangiella marina]|uniref:Ion-translocating oxidoreductase complex subunit D n=1 Tax=Aliikangiella marina TaxID=1712262 RepID=A0A545T338_9GAMM|nr:electron transport complex subunit RsxD [Aliikangiella marina]TQV71633.1 electron transport complex subunit RsxD [Aliikangiella marina]
MMNLSSPFFHKAMPTNKVMMLVCVALIPGIITQVYFFGFGVIINLILCAVFAVSAEYTILKLRTREPRTSIQDNSALLTGLLLAVALPPTLPFWMTFVGVWFAIIFGKQLYGGLGYNPFNPAMVGYVLLLISFPVEMTAWLPARELAVSLPSFYESSQLIFFAQTADGLTVENFRQLADGFTMATPLDHLKTETTLGRMNSEIFANPDMALNLNGWKWVNLMFLLGGLYLLAIKIVRWHIPVAYLLAMIITSFLLNTYDNQLYAAPSFHLLTGATMLGAFFIATDPVSASTTPKGRLIYGALIGFLIVIIRTFGGYPDAIAFAVLLLNIAVPTIDHYTKPVIYGHKKETELHD